MKKLGLCERRGRGHCEGRRPEAIPQRSALRARFTSFAVTLLVTACSHQRVLESPIHPVDAGMFWRDQAVRRGFLTSFSGKLKMSYDGKDQEVSGKGRIVGRAPNGFRVELRDPIGRLHYVLVQKGTQFAVHYPRNKQAVKEAVGGKAYFKKVLGKDLVFSDLALVFAGVVPAKWDKAKFESWEWDKSKGAFRGIAKQGDETLTVWVDSGNESLQALVWEAGGDKVEATYQDYDKCCEGMRGSFALGYEAKVTLPGQDTAMEVVWESLKRQDIPVAAFDFQPAAGDRVVEIR